MAKEHAQRKLAAILAADVVGYARLMELDEVGTISRLKTFRRELFEPKAKENGGRIFKTMGDGVLVEFASAAGAIRSAVDIQKTAAEQIAQTSDVDPIRLRIGISLGDVIIEGDDLYGNGVNIAARLEALAEPGGICISGNLQEHVKTDDEFSLMDLGTCNVKNIAEPVRLYQVNLDTVEPNILPPISLADQEIRFCRGPGGVQIAHATVGQGPPVVFVANWLTHLELDWQIPSRRAIFEMLAKDHRLVRYDARGSGLSDWDVEDISFEKSVGDLTAVIDDLGLDNCALVGQSQGAAVASAYAARNPGKVSHLVLYGGYARGRRKRGSEGQIAESDAFITMIREGWGKKLDAYVRMFGSFFMPDANSDQLAGFTEFQRKATPPENAARIQLAIDDIDISSELSEVAAPTLVLHVRDDARAPFEEGRRMAAAISNARFVPLEGRNHTMLVGEPALQRYLDEIERFLRH